MKEIWKDVAGYEGLYQVSDLGRVKSLDRVIPRKRNGNTKVTGGIMKMQTNHNGYKTIMLSKEDIRNKKFIWLSC